MIVEKTRKGMKKGKSSEKSMHRWHGLLNFVMLSLGNPREETR